VYQFTYVKKKTSTHANKMNFQIQIILLEIAHLYMIGVIQVHVQKIVHIEILHN